MNDTIFALSTLLGKSGVAVFRVSGPKSLALGKQLAFKARGGGELNFTANKAHYCLLKNPLSHESIDECIVIFYQGPNSFTGEDILEIQTHGSLAVIKEINALLPKLGIRPAEAGEFSKRAFLNGKMDLTEAEGLAQLIEAETAIQRKVALAQLQGSNANLYEAWRQRLISALARLEVLIDYPEEDIPIEIVNAVNLDLQEISTEISAHLAQASLGEVVKSGITIAIIGKPNVGKSSLLNFLSNRDVAIVTEIAGTTRDIIEARLELNGYLVNLIDTAGLRETDNIVEGIGINKALSAARDAKLVLWLSESVDDEPPIDLNQFGQVIRVLTKQDLASEQASPDFIAISTKTGFGISSLLQMLTTFITENFAVADTPIITNERYKYHLANALNSLDTLSLKMPLDIYSENLRGAAAEIGRITGKIDLEEVLDELFGKFCVGK
jgi:tRNA modification GTPase